MREKIIAEWLKATLLIMYSSYMFFYLILFRMSELSQEILNIYHLWFIFIIPLLIIGIDKIIDLFKKDEKN